MKRRIKHILLVASIGMLVASSTAYPSEKKWDLEIKLDKATYVIFEPIWLDVTLTNMTFDTLGTDGFGAPNQREFFIDVRDRDGNTLEYTGAVPLAAFTPYNLLIEPGKDIYGSFNLLAKFGSYSGGSGYSVPAWFFPYLRTGTYSVQVRIEDVKSNIMTFEVIGPAGSEKEALELIGRATAVWKPRCSDPSAQIFREVVDKFPNSVFVETCYFLSIGIRKKRYDEMRAGTYDDRAFNRDMLMHFPNSGECGGWLSSMTYELNDVKKLDTLNKYAELYPNTRCSRFATQKRRQLEQRLAREGGGK